MHRFRSFQMEYIALLSRDPATASLQYMEYPLQSTSVIQRQQSLFAFPPELAVAVAGSIAPIHDSLGNALTKGAIFNAVDLGIV